MANDGPSNPSNKSDTSDDLIEELARLMASDAQGSKSTASDTAEPARPAGDTSASASDIKAGRPSWQPDPKGRETDEGEDTPEAPEPVAAPPRDSASGSPGWRPEPKKPAERQEPSFDQPPAPEQPSDPQSSGPQPFRFEFGPAEPADNAGPTSPEASETDTTTGFDLGLGPRHDDGPESTSSDTVRSGTPEPAVEMPEASDPIGELIRDDDFVNTDEAESSAPEPQQDSESERRDSFNVPPAPAFGFGSQDGGDAADTPDPSQHTPQRSMGGSDALGDIENLIGNAARVDFPQGDPAQQAVEQSGSRRPEQTAAPQQPPASEAGPRGGRTGRDDGVDAAETAILAAMGGGADSSGPMTDGDDQPVQRADHAYADEAFAAERDAEPEEDKPGGFAWGRVAAPIIALLLLGGAGYAGYVMLTSTPSDGEAPVLVADSEPAKETPEPEEPADGADQSIVFGNDGADADNEQLVSRDQSQDGIGGDNAGDGLAGDGLAGDDDAIRQIITADTSENGLANRKVRTVTVRPDGTIVRGDDQVAGGEALPVERPEVPDLPEDAVQSDDSDTALASLIGDQAATPDAVVQDQQADNLVAVDGEAVPFPEARPTDLAALRAAFTPAPAPTNDTTSSAQTSSGNTLDLLGGESQGQAQAPAQTQASTPAQSAPAASSTNPAAWVQLSSQQSEAVATQVANDLRTRYASALSGREMLVQRADLGDRGTWYRVLVPAASLSDAQGVCVQIQNAGGDCFPRPN